MSFPCVARYKKAYSVWKKLRMELTCHRYDVMNVDVYIFHNIKAMSEFL